MAQLFHAHLLFKAHGQHAAAGIIEQVAHGDAVVNVAHRLRKHGRCGKDLDLAALPGRRAIHRIRRNQELDRAFLDLFNALLLQNHVR